MAEYTRGQESRREGHSGHNKGNMEKARQRQDGIDFEQMNYEERRAPYGYSSRTGNSEQEDIHQAHRERRDDR